METQKLSSEIRVNCTLRESIITLCKAMVPFKSQLSIQGIIGITIDNTEILLLDVRETEEKAKLNESLASQQEPVSAVKTELDNDCVGCSISSSTLSLQAKQETVDNGLNYQAEPELKQSTGTREEVWDNLDDSVDGYDAGGDYMDEYDRDEDYAGDGYGVNEEEGYDDTGDVLPDYSAHIDYDISDQVYSEEEYAIDPQSSSTRQPNMHLNLAQRLNTFQNPGYKHSGSPCTSKMVQHGRVNRSQPASRSSLGFGSKRASATRLPPDLGATCSTMYTCSFCGDHFKHLHSFLRHKEKHDGIKYECEFCKRSFSRKDNCNRHERKCELNPNAHVESQDSL